MIGLLSLFADAAGATVNCASGAVCSTGLPTVGAGNAQLQAILKVVFGLLAAIAVLMVMIGGFRYVISEGNPDGTKKARSTILYAVIGLVIALSAEAIVSFFLGAS